MMLGRIFSVCVLEGGVGVVVAALLCVVIGFYLDCIWALCLWLMLLFCRVLWILLVTVYIILCLGRYM